jgi:hypothetical protein
MYYFLSLGVKRSGCEADHSPPSSAEVKEWVELFLQYAFMAWCTVKAQGQLYLYLLCITSCRKYCKSCCRLKWCCEEWEVIYWSSCRLFAPFSTSPVFYHCPTLNLHSCCGYCLFTAECKREHIAGCQLGDVRMVTLSGMSAKLM